MFDPMGGGVKWHDRQKIKTYSDCSYQTTMENARVGKKISRLSEKVVLVPPLSNGRSYLKLTKKHFKLIFLLDLYLCINIC